MATKKPKGLGRGLEALLGPAADTRAPRQGADDTAPSGPAVQTLPLSALQAGRYQPRTRIDEGGLYELAESIKAQGIMQPLLVRPLHRASGSDEPASYEIIAGERRFRAASLAGLQDVPVLVRDVDDRAAAAMALIENMQREDLNPLEEAQGLARLVQEFGLSHEEAAQAVGRSRSAASNLLRLLQLTEPVQTMLMAGDIDMGHARALLALDKARQVTAAHEIAARKMTVREAERLVQRLASQTTSPATPRQAPAEKSRDLARLEETLSDHFTATVEIRLKQRGRQAQQGELAIRFSSLDELNGILDKLVLPPQ